MHSATILPATISEVSRRSPRRIAEQLVERGLAGEERLVARDQRHEADAEAAECRLRDRSTVQRAQGTVDDAEGADHDQARQRPDGTDEQRREDVPRVHVRVRREVERGQRVERRLRENAEAEEARRRRNEHRDQEHIEVVAGDRRHLEADERGRERRAEEQRKDRADAGHREELPERLPTHARGNPGTERGGGKVPRARDCPDREREQCRQHQAGNRPHPDSLAKSVTSGRGRRCRERSG
jgi:hypothetical protein